MKKIIKTFLLVILITITLIMNASPVFATDGLDDVISQGDSFINAGNKKTPINAENIKPISDKIYNILFVIGVAVASVIFAVLGIKFMVGSVEEKADIKKQLITFLVGCAVIFGAFGIWKIVVTILQAIH